MSKKRTDFVEALVEDYTETLGYAEKVDNLTIRSLDGESTLQFDSVIENNEAVGVQVFVNGTLDFEGSYTDENFSEDLAKAVVYNLNV